MSEIITIRPTEDIQKIIFKKKSEGVNISGWIKNLITSCESERKYIAKIRTIPEESGEKYPSLEECIAHSTSFSQLNLRRYAEARRIVNYNGIDYFNFCVDKENGISISIIAINREEASSEFLKYYKPLSSGEYIRTDLPLPKYRYDIASSTVIIITYE